MNRCLRNILMLLLGIALIPGAWAAGPWHAAGQNTAGWQLMTPNERVAHQRRMRSFETYEKCSAYQAEHHARMAERAQREGITLERKPETGCEQLQQRGRFK